MRCDIVPANETLLGELYVNHLEYKSDIRYQREMRELEEYVKTLKPEEIF